MDDSQDDLHSIEFDSMSDVSICDDRIIHSLLIPKKEQDPMFWKRFLQEGEHHFMYMTHNYESMLDKESRIPHFTIRPDINCERYDTCEIKKIYDDELQKELIGWLKNEMKEMRLLDTTNWKPFRDTIHLMYFYLGYRKLFSFKEYYFQIGIDKCYEDVCNDCKINNMGNSNSDIHFELSVFGIKNKFNNSIYTYIDKTIDLPDDNIPDFYWNLK